MLQAAAMIQIKSFAPFPLPLMFGCSVKMHVRNTVGRQALMFWALTQVALAGLQGPVLQPEARPRRPITRRPLSHINSVRTGSENEGRTLREQAAGPGMWMRLCVDDGMDRLATERNMRGEPISNCKPTGIPPRTQPALCGSRGRVLASFKMSCR